MTGFFSVVLIVFMAFPITSFAGPISEYCSELSTGNIELEDGVDFYKKFDANIIQPLSHGTPSMVAYGKALELNIVTIGRQLSEESHCSMIEVLEEENVEVNVQKTVCTGHTKGKFWGSTYHEAKKLSLTFCSIGGWDGPQETLLTYCDNSLVEVGIEYKESSQSPGSVEFSADHFVEFGLDESGITLKMQDENGKELFMHTAGDPSPVKDDIWTLKNITGEGQKQKFKNHTCKTQLL